MHSLVRLGITSCLLTVLVGCSDAPELPTAVPAAGKVTFNSKPCPAGASIVLVPVGGGRPSTGITDANGAFVLSTFGDKDGAVPGEHFVGVTLVETKGGPTVQVDEYTTGTPEGQESQVEVTWIVPERFSQPEQSGVKATVPEEGTDALEITLTE